MASDFPGRPLLLKAALVVFETPVPVPTNIIIFQYNPESMTRRLTQQRADLTGQLQLLTAGDCPVCTGRELFDLRRARRGRSA
jgi:hypothetical protein